MFNWPLVLRVLMQAIEPATQFEIIASLSWVRRRPPLFGRCRDDELRWKMLMMLRLPILMKMIQSLSPYLLFSRSAESALITC
jgi:hypothetical protein